MQPPGVRAEQALVGTAGELGQIVIDHRLLPLIFLLELGVQPILGRVRFGLDPDLELEPGDPRFEGSDPPQAASSKSKPIVKQIPVTFEYLNSGDLTKHNRH